MRPGHVRSFSAASHAAALHITVRGAETVNIITAGSIIAQSFLGVAESLVGPAYLFEFFFGAHVSSFLSG